MLQPPTLTANPAATRSAYPDDLRAIMNIARAQENRRWLRTWSGISPSATPLYDLPDLAQRLGVACVHLKDESVRSPIASFKALGAPIALVRQILRLYPGFDPSTILTGHYADRLKHYTVISATDGNHGRALALAARDAGCGCVIVLHAEVSTERETAIAELGADIVRIAGNYDASVEHAARLAAEHGWQVVSDTSYDGYQDIPADVMQGYATIAAEVLEQHNATPEHPPYSHVFLQGGVGGMPAGIIGFFWEYHGTARPHFVVAEPEQADCLTQSALQGRAAHATGSVDSVMAGLACGAASPLAWRFLANSVDHFMTVSDADAVAAMRALAQGSARDIPIIAGESGTAGLVALTRACSEAALSAQLGLDDQARVLLISTEGATAPQHYAQAVGATAAAVAARQAAHQGNGSVQRGFAVRADC